LDQPITIAHNPDILPSPFVVLFYAVDKAFARAAQGIQLLIHEATFTDAHQTHATQKRHSTVLEAIDIAKKANAVRLICTHFSQRWVHFDPPNISFCRGTAYSRRHSSFFVPFASYLEPPSLPPGATTFAAMAFDGMRVSVAQLDTLPAVWSSYCRKLREQKALRKPKS
jgi:hypothetical protein